MSQETRPKPRRPQGARPSVRAAAFFAIALLGAAIPRGRLASATASVQSGRDIVTSGVPVERALAGGQTHVFQLVLDGEACVRIAVDQRGVDVTIAVLDTAGRTLREENRLSEQGIERLLWIGPGAGSYTVTVGARDRRAATGTYRLRIDLSSADEARKQAFERYTEGWRLARVGRAGYSANYASTYYTESERLQRALADLEGALPYWRSTSDDDLTAITLFEIGALNVKLKKFADGLACLREASDRFRAAERRTEEAMTLNEIGYAYSVQGDYENAGNSFVAALALADALPRDELADLTFNHAVTLQNQSRHGEALAFFERARAEFRALGKVDLELQTISEIGRTHFAAGEMVPALTFANEGLSSSRTHHMPMLEARFAQDIARVYLHLDDYDRAREYGERSIALFQGEHYINGEVATLLLLGDAQYGLNDLRAARASYERAASLAHSNTFKEAEARAALKLGTVLAEIGDFDRALAQRQGALAYYRATGNRRSEVNTLFALGSTYRRMGRHQEAAGLLEDALRLSRGAAGHVSETQIVGELALVARDEGRFEDARDRLQPLLRRFDEERRSLLAPSLSVTFVGGGQNWYEVYADLLMRQREAHSQNADSARAWSAVEHAKAWGLLEMLDQARSDLGQGVDQTLIEKRRELWSRMAARAAEAERAPVASASPATGAAIDDLEVQLRLAEAEIRAAAPRYVDLVEPQPVTLEQLQRELLDANTVLLEFAPGDLHSWLWSVTDNAFDSFELAPVSEIDAAARRLYELLTARQQKSGSAALERRGAIVSSDAELPAVAARLGHLLLAPVESRLRGEWRDKRLVVVASGALEYVPFGVLELSDGRPLLADHEIVSLPSATVLAAIRRDSAARPRAKRAVALIGDPVFDIQDPRIRRTPKRAAASSKAKDRTRAGAAPAAQLPSPTSPDDDAQADSARPLMRGDFARLPFTRREIASIAALGPPDSMLQATDFRASRALAMSGELGQFRIVHFATHGLLNSQHPELSGLVLSLVDERGRPQNGFLRLQEIYNLRLPAELVVLSACQTALGREVKGEGLVGLTRGFMYAGAKRVVASLWQVDDLATAELMKAFYRNMLQGGLSPSAALRDAQLEIRGHARWAAPYYWAAFTLQGEWR